jgi:hypothetical protein
MLASIFVGFDPRQAAAFAVARNSLERRDNLPIPVRGLVLSSLRERGLYWRPHEMRDGRLWDPISEAFMATEFSNSRFLTYHLARELQNGSRRERGWALFIDCDVLVRTSIDKIVAGIDRKKALVCVQHRYEPPEGSAKMDGQVQQLYARKNWSSVMLFNLDHPANEALTPGLINTLPGRDLHRFCWLADEEIGALSPSWNWLAGHSDADLEPDIVHFTEGLPDVPGYENTPYADEWRVELARWAAAR